MGRGAALQGPAQAVMGDLAGGIRTAPGLDFKQAWILNSNNRLNLRLHELKTACLERQNRIRAASQTEVPGSFLEFPLETGDA